LISRQTPLAVAAEHGHLCNIRLLLEYRARADMLDGLGFSALDLAIKGGHTECSAALQTAKATQEASRLETYSELLEACIEGNYEQLLHLVKMLRDDLQFVINMTLEGSNTLLFK